MAAAFPITLTEGVYPNPEAGEPFAANAGPFAARLLSLTSRGDIDGDRRDDAALLVSVTEGESALLYLVTAETGPRGALQTAAALLGGDLAISSLQIVDGQIALEMEKPGPFEALCCPVAAVRRIYDLIDGALRLVESQTLETRGLPAPARAIRPEPIQFERGETTVALGNGIGSGEVHAYSVAAHAGDRLSASVEPDSGDVVLVLYGGAEPVVYRSARTGLTAWSQLLPLDQEYVLGVANTGAATPYTLTVTLDAAASVETQP